MSSNLGTLPLGGLILGATPMVEDTEHETFRPITLVVENRANALAVKPNSNNLTVNG